MDVRFAFGAWGALQFSLLLWSGLFAVLQTVLFGALPMLVILIAYAEDLAPLIGFGRQKTANDGEPVLQSTEEREDERPDEEAESTKWLDFLCEQMWPHIATYLEDFIRSFEPTIQAYMPMDCRFKTCSLGKEFIRFGPVKPRLVSCYCEDRLVENGGVELKIGVKYSSKVDVELATKVANFGVSHLAFSGTLSLLFRPFLDKAPFYGGIEVLFNNPPNIELEFKGIGNLAEIPGIQGRIQKAVDDFIASILVQPNRWIFPQFEESEMDLARMRKPCPEGVLRITVVKAENLRDTALGKTCDPCVQIHLGGETFKTPTITRATNPEWTHGNVKDFVVYSLEQWVQVNVYSSDRISGDHPLGSINRCPVQKLIENAGRGPVPMHLGWHKKMTRRPSESTLLYLQFDWLVLDQPSQQDASALDNRLNPNEQEVSKYLLTLKVDECTGLPDIDMNAPFTLRMSIKGDEANGKSTIPGWARSKDPALFGELLDKIRKLSSRGVEDSVIAEVMGQDTDTIKGLLRADRSSGEQRRYSLDDEAQRAERKAKDEKWIQKWKTTREERDLRCNPQFEDVIVLLLPRRDVTVVVELIDDPVKRRKSKDHGSNGIIAYFEVKPTDMVFMRDGPFHLLDSHRGRRSSGSLASNTANMMSDARLHATFTLWQLQSDESRQPRTSSSSFTFEDCEDMGAVDAQPRGGSPIRKSMAQAAQALSNLQPRPVAKMSKQLHRLGNMFEHKVGQTRDGIRQMNALRVRSRSEDRIEEVVQVIHQGSGQQVYKALKLLRDSAEWEQAVQMFDARLSGSQHISMVDVVERKLDAEQCQKIASKLHDRGIGNGRWPICTTTLDAFLDSR